MIKSAYFPNITFSTQEDLFVALKRNEDLIIETKKSIVYNSSIDTVKSAVPLTLIDTRYFEDTEKGVGFRTKENYMYPVISTTNYLDSHDDVHWLNSMNQTAKDQQGKVYFCTDHLLTSDGIVVTKSNIEMFIKSIPWSLLGKPYEGNTNALIFGFDKKNIIHDKAAKILEVEKDIQCSIRMVYKKVILAMNSNHKDHAENLKYFNENVDKIANKEVAYERGYFFGVESLGIRGEGSMVLGGGSNDATIVYETKTEEADTVTSEDIEPLQSTQKTLSQFDMMKTILSTTKIKNNA